MARTNKKKVKGKNKMIKNSTRRPVRELPPHINATINKEFPNHPLNEKENEEYDVAIWFYREALGAHLKANTVHTPSQKRGIIEMMESIITDLG